MEEQNLYIGKAIKKVDWDLVDELLEAGCTGVEIAPHFNMHPETFYERVVKEKNMKFSHYAEIKANKGNSLLRKVQYNKALSGDNTMLVWLGKQRLKQRETPVDVTISEETINNFKAAMDQISRVHEFLKNSESKQ